MPAATACAIDAVNDAENDAVIHVDDDDDDRGIVGQTRASTRRIAAARDTSAEQQRR